MSPMPARDEVIRKLASKFKDIDTGLRGAKLFAETAVDFCLPNLHPRSCGGKSLVERMWEELMALMDVLDQEPDNDLVRGQMQNAAYFIAMVQNPYHTNVDSVKKEARRRWLEGQDE